MYGGGKGGLWGASLASMSVGRVGSTLIVVCWSDVSGCRSWKDER